jgi:hypothetical protein
MAGKNVGFCPFFQWYATFADSKNGTIKLGNHQCCVALIKNQ